MLDRRLETRLLCADVVSIHWKEKGGRSRTATALLEDISTSGACLQLDVAVPTDVVIHMIHAKARLEGRVSYCVFREVGYFAGIRFEKESKWSRRHFKPQHLLNPEAVKGKPKKLAFMQTKTVQ